ncbi:hypothetical protein [Novosphingobium lentum]|uniref:hypothetical protein n=1 Tax=Novosphingobium lentum TaxID=145287 RepID=UPI000AA645E1|nr:hypothetical protein [Novosphingobium lentum]
MSFREKSAWVMGALMVAAGLYYVDIALAASRGIGQATPPVSLFIPFTLLVVTVSVVVQAAMAILAPKAASAPADEREKPLLDRAGHWSGIVLGAGAATSLLRFVYQQDGILLFHMIMASLIVSQIAEYAFQIVLIRRNS